MILNPPASKQPGRLAVGDAHEALGIGMTSPEPEPLAPGADPVAHALRVLGIAR